MKLSIIVPVYNIDKYVTQCLDSIVPQLTNEVELIMVNDGSTDNCGMIIEQIAKSNPVCKIIHKNNGGLGSARNVGLLNAIGEYIWFVDGDDEIDKNAVNTFFENYPFMSASDIIFFSTLHRRLDTDVLRLENKLIDLVDVNVYEFFAKMEIMPATAWCFFYKKSFLQIHSLRFEEGILHEDNEFMLRVYNKVSKVSSIARTLYIYKAREGSIMKSKINSKKILSVFKIIETCLFLTPDHLKKETLDNQLYWFINWYLEIIKCSDDKIFYQRKLYQLIKRQKIYRSDPIGMIKNKIVYNLFKTYI